MTGVRIGELNGRWALLLKTTVVVIPILTALVTAAFLPWSVWVTSNIYTMQNTTAVIDDLVKEAKAVDIRIDALPPDEWRARIRVLEDDAKQNQKDHQVIIVSLEQIKGAVGVKPNDK